MIKVNADRLDLLIEGKVFCLFLRGKLDQVKHVSVGYENSSKLNQKVSRGITKLIDKFPNAEMFVADIIAIKERSQIKYGEKYCYVNSKGTYVPINSEEANELHRNGYDVYRVV